MAIKTPTKGDDVIIGSELADFINSLGGDDLVVGLKGNDFLRGGEGDDLLFGVLGHDTLVGDGGDDAMFGGGGHDRMIWNNGDGSDIMEGGAGVDTAEVNGSSTSGDVFDVSVGEDGRVDFARTNFGLFSLDIGSTEVLEINAGGGDDVITGGEGLKDLIQLDITGGRGNDTITGGDGDDELNGNAGNDVLVGFKGNDVMNGGVGHDRMIWNNGDGSDIMDGGAGFDTVEINGSSTSGDVFRLDADGADFDFARTNFGQFTIDISNSEVIELNGGGGNDIIIAAEDLARSATLDLNGGDGNDRMTGGNTDDRIDGGAGNDRMTGGTGADTFVFSEGLDLIMDFEQGVDQVEIIAGIGFDPLENLTQAGNNVVLEIGDDRMTFVDQTIEDFSEDDFSILAVA